MHLRSSGYWLPGYKLEKSWAMAIHVCVMYNAVETALVLLQKGAAINRMPNGKTPLHVACEVSNSDCVALLLAHGAKVNCLSLSGHAPLHYCIARESVDCAKQLILKGEDNGIQSVYNGGNKYLIPCGFCKLDRLNNLFTFICTEENICN